MSLSAVVIDERTRSRGSEAQSADWQATCRELLTQANETLDYDAVLHVAMTEQNFILRTESPSGETMNERTIAHDLLTDHITEYVDIVRQISDAEGVNQLEALDMAKKVTHDRAGRLLKRELRDFQFDHKTARRLFTLLLSMRVDITRLSGIHGHRPIR